MATIGKGAQVRRMFVEAAAAASTPAELERAFRAWLKTERGSTAQQRAVREALEAAGWRLIEASSLAARIPRIVRKGRRIAVAIGGAEHRLGSWGNGAGYRWLMADAMTLTRRIGGYRSQRLLRSVFDWVRCGFPHRALRELQRSARAKPAPAP